MRTTPLKTPSKNSHHTTSPSSQLTILIRIEPFITSLPQLKQKCLLPIAPPTTPRPQSPSMYPRSLNPRRTTGQKSPIPRREDAFRIELPRGSSVCTASTNFVKSSLTYCRRQGQRSKGAPGKRCREPSPCWALLQYTRSR